MKKWLEGLADTSDCFANDIFTCRECRETCKKAESEVPCVVEECQLLWWGEEKPKWARADAPPGWEAAFEIYKLSHHVSVEIALEIYGIDVADLVIDTIEKFVFLSSNVKRLEAEKMKSANKNNRIR